MTARFLRILRDMLSRGMRRFEVLADTLGIGKGRMRMRIGEVDIDNRS